MCKLLAHPIFYTLLGIFIGWFLGYWSSKRLLHLGQKLEAKRRLREVFHEFIAWIEIKNFASNVLIEWLDYLHMQDIALREYRCFVKSKKKAALDDAWHNYFDRETGEEHWKYYWYNQPELLKKIEALLRLI